MGGLPKDKAPFTATVEGTWGLFEVRLESLTLGAAVQVATQPVGRDAVEVVWEINDVLPAVGKREKSYAAPFLGKDGEKALADKSFQVLASLDGKTFTKIATVEGPANRYVHAGLETGLLHYYKVAAFGKDGKPWVESGVAMGAAGPNLAGAWDFESFPPGPCTAKADQAGALRVKQDGVFEVAKGSRPYSRGVQVLRFAGKQEGGEGEVRGARVPLSPGGTYLQGAWVKASGRAAPGREFVDEKEQAVGLSSAGYVSDSPEWTFLVQRLMPDADGSGWRRVPRAGGEMRNYAMKSWTMPKEARGMAPVLTSVSGEGECDDMWVVEVHTAPEGAAVKP